MTDIQKRQIAEMRHAGTAISKIADILGISRNTVKSYCKRHNIDVGGTLSYQIGDVTLCEQCGKEITQNSLKRYKRFCSDKCRNKWWNTHPNLVTRKAFYEHTCKHCGKPFSAYGNARRKFCSHECYIAERFGGDADE